MKGERSMSPGDFVVGAVRREGRGPWLVVLEGLEAIRVQAVVTIGRLVGWECHLGFAAGILVQVDRL